MNTTTHQIPAVTHASTKNILSVLGQAVTTAAQQTSAVEHQVCFNHHEELA